ncbi:C-type lectin lectoxin-Lio2-like isoform X2 [Corythoichthys intestinalis]|uniref:C-type lectin lectoxin-Lio2-like isoform X2 n=1 Tax=Corythoichthys intestinalis TaxID=161448 RepID=UPI0025A5781E|nr:C-type lectin lectoxin-Lio2-like isoform X2 [Corythoichthys intestinalis]
MPWCLCNLHHPKFHLEEIQALQDRIQECQDFHECTNLCCKQMPWCLCNLHHPKFHLEEIQMTLFLRSLFLFCGISALSTGVNPFSFWNFWKPINNCPKGWTQLDCHCYIFQSEARDSADAQSVCEILGGDLVSIQDMLENSFVAGIGEDAEDDLIWLGIDDLSTDGTFTWNDGAGTGFSAFGEGEPSETCVAMDVTDGSWQDEDCDSAYPYVCIRDVVDHT